jgi:drug/metabolite transporter (DMT)-like permease
MILPAATQATLLGLGAAGVWGTSDFAGGFVTRRTFPALVVTLAHGLSMLVIWLLLAGLHPAPPAPSTVLYGVLSGIVGGVGLMLFYEGLALGTMGLTAAIAGVLTAVLPVVYSFFNDGRPSPAQLAGFVLAAVAIWLIAYTPGGKPHPRGLGLATAAGIGFGLLMIFLQKAGAGSIAWTMALSRTTSTTIALSLSLGIFIRRKWRLAPDIEPDTEPDPVPDFAPAAAPAGHSGLRFLWRSIVPLAALAGALDTAGNVLYTLSSLRGRLDVAAVLASLYPGITILLAAVLLREHTTRTQTLGMLLALAAVVLISF